MDPGAGRGSRETERGSEAGRPQPGPFCVHRLALWHVPSPSRYMACANPRGRGHRSSLGKGRVLEDRGRCRLDWVSRGYIYIYKGCRVPWSWPLPEGATLGGPARHAFLPRGWLSIYSPRQAGQGELRREGWKGWREKRALPPSLLPKEPLIVKARSKLGQGEVCPCSRSHSPPPCLALRWKKRCWGKPPP